ncbi:MAG TPA: flagellar FlbD family protein [Bryobacteraceae bacterium]|nr:flagellar FlbD family protein [Bryobacteraceae bacterium]
MIYVTRLNHKPLVINSDLIEQVEMTPDTVISLTTGEKIMVLESSDEIVERVVNFRRSIAAGPARPVPTANRVAPGELDGGY